LAVLLSEEIIFIAMSLSLLGLYTPEGAVPGTGLINVTATAQEQLGPLPPTIVDFVVSELPGLFGDYPNHSDIAPSAIFLAVFLIIAVAHFYVFARDYQRGHKFWISFGLGTYAMFKVIGFALRVAWATNVLLIRVGIAATTFCQVSVLYLNVLCMILGHRIFTWRHPETGSCRWFNILVDVVYFLVVGVIVMAIVGQTVPIIFFLGPSHVKMCQQVVQVAAVLNLLYALSGLTLVNLAYTFKPGTIDNRFFRMPRQYHKEELPRTIQATWIESCNMFYFVRKGSQVSIYKDEPLANAIRVIPSDTPPASGLCQSHNPEHYNGPKISTAIMIVVSTSLILTMNVAFRVAWAFTTEVRGGAPATPGGPPATPINAWIFHNYVFYIWYGATEAMVSVIYLVFRIDLRFYLPDMARKRRAGDPPLVDTFDNGLASTGREKVTSAEAEHVSLESPPQAERVV
jgi:hypothetical protein